VCVYVCVCVTVCVCERESPVIAVCGSGKQGRNRRAKEKIHRESEREGRRERMEKIWRVKR